jgi:membrane protease YdiL (CAAX protease family)
MPLFAQQSPPVGFIVFLFLAIAACILSWVVIFERLATGKPILPYQGRRQVPWNVFDLLAIIIFYFSCAVMVVAFVQYFFPSAVGEAYKNVSNAKQTTAHPIAQLMADGNWTSLVLCCVFGVIVAPIFEELFYRVLLQGWLEKINRKVRRRIQLFGQSKNSADIPVELSSNISEKSADRRPSRRIQIIPILISSLIFAAQHFRVAEPQKDVMQLTYMMLINAVYCVFLFVFVIAWVCVRKGATARDLGWNPKRFFADIKLGFASFVAITPLIYMVNVIMFTVLPKQYAIDPIPIFILAIVLGTLYNRTHRAAPSIAMHMAFNASSLLMVLLLNGG